MIKPVMDDERLVNLDRYMDLANAIIKRAAEDYLMAVKYRDQIKTSSLERYFRSDQFLMFTDYNIDPDYFIKMLREKGKRKKKA